MKSRCEHGVKDFWDTVKPFFTDKGKGGSNRIMSNNGNSIDKPHEVVTTFNEYFVNVASDIGKPDTVTEDMDIQTIVNTHANHPSVRWIKSNVSGNYTFKFYIVTPETLDGKKLQGLHPSKAISPDNIPPRLIKAGAEQLCDPSTSRINLSIIQDVFPSHLKKSRGNTSFY